MHFISGYWVEKNTALQGGRIETSGENNHVNNND